MLEPYDNWVDFGLGMKNGDNFGRESANPNASLVNFVAAYGKHDDHHQRLDGGRQA